MSFSPTPLKHMNCITGSSSSSFGQKGKEKRKDIALTMMMRDRCSVGVINK
jgi:hypothetical protein